MIFENRCNNLLLELVNGSWAILWQRRTIVVPLTITVNGAAIAAMRAVIPSPIAEKTEP